MEKHTREHLVKVVRQEVVGAVVVCLDCGEIFLTNEEFAAA